MTKRKLEVIVVINLKIIVEVPFVFCIVQKIKIEPQVVIVKRADINQCWKKATVKHPEVFFGPGEKKYTPKHKNMLKISKTLATDKFTNDVTF